MLKKNTIIFSLEILTFLFVSAYIFYDLYSIFSAVNSAPWYVVAAPDAMLFVFAMAVLAVAMYFQGKAHGEAK